MRWRLKLEEYDYKIIHKVGKGNTNADALSRNLIRNDEHIHNVQAKEREDDTKEGKKSTTKEHTKEEKQQILYEYHDEQRGKDKKNKIAT